MRSKRFNFYVLCTLLCAVHLQAQELMNYPLDTINGEEVYRYEVERSIGLYRIGVNFNVSQADIVRLNPQLRERGLHFGETLYLPTGRKVEKLTKKEAKPVVVETVLPQPEPKPIDSIVMPIETLILPDSLVMDSFPIFDTTLKDPRPVVELALMLPFESQQSKRSGNAERMLEFYQGALIALYQQQNDTIKYRLRVYDTERSERRVNELCDSTELDSVKGVLGLVYPIQIARMTTWSETRKVPILLPFSDDTNLAAHPRLLQFNSTDKQTADSLCQWILNNDSDLHCVAIEVKEAELATPIRTLRKRMTDMNIAFESLPIKSLMIDSADFALDKNKENLIILHSNRFQHIRILLPHLQSLQQAGYRIRIVSQYSWQKENINLPQVYTSMFRGNTDWANYEALWQKFYAGDHVSDAPRYDILGYDLMNTLIDWINGKKETTGLQSTIRWQQVNEGGFQNECVNVLTY